MKLKEWFKSCEHLNGTSRVSQSSFKLRIENSSRKSPWSRTHLRKWRDQFYSADPFPSSPLTLTRASAQTLSLPPLEWFNFKNPPYSSKIINTGHTTVVKGSWYQGRKKPYLTGGPLMDQKYVFYHSHFHWGESEHALQGEIFPMEVHSVFFNAHYKTYETALKESDGILIVAQFCRLLPESSTRPQTSQNVLLLKDHSSVTSKIQHRTSNIEDDGRQLRLKYTQVPSGRTQNMAQQTHELHEYKTCKPSDSTRSRFPLLETVYGDRSTYRDSTSHMSQCTTGEISPERPSNHMERGNEFIAEVAKNVRFVSSVNTSKLIHAHSLDVLLPQFSNNYFLYRTGIRRPQTTHRVTWIIDDKNHLSITRAQLTSFHILRRTTKNSRRTRSECSAPGSMFYIVNQADDIKTESNDTFIIIHEKINKIPREDKIKCGSSEESTLKIFDHTNIENENLQNIENNDVNVLIHVEPDKTKKENENLQNIENNDANVLIHVEPDKTKKENENLQNIENNNVNVLIHLEPDKTKNELIPLLEKGRQTTLKNDGAMHIIETTFDSNFCSTNSTSRNKIISFSEFYHLYFYENCRSAFRDIVNSINFNIDIPYCSRLDTSIGVMSKTLSKMSSKDSYISYRSDQKYYDEHNLKTTLSLIPSNKIILTCKFEKIMKILLPQKILYQKFKTNDQTTFKVSFIKREANKYKLKNKYTLRKPKKTKMNPSIMSIVISQTNINVASIINNAHEMETSAVQNDNEADNIKVDAGESTNEVVTLFCARYIDSNIFKPLSIPSFSKDLENDFKCITSSLKEYSKSEKHHLETKLSVDSKIPRPKYWASEKEKSSTTTAGLQPSTIIVLKPPTTQKCSFSAPANTNRVKGRSGPTIPLTRHSSDNTNGTRATRQSQVCNDKLMNTAQKSLQANNTKIRIPKTKRLFLRKKEDSPAEKKETLTTDEPSKTINRLVQPVTDTKDQKTVGKLEVLNASATPFEKAVTKKTRAERFARKYKLKSKREQC